MPNQKRWLSHTISRRVALLASVSNLLLLGIGTEAKAGLRVVTTLTDLAAIAKGVGGENVDVTALAEPNQDPHYVDGRPSFLVPLSRAQLLAVNGLQLEVGWLPPLITNARNASILPGSPGYFDASAFVERLEIPAGAVDRAQGDIHPGGNPHFLYDPRSAQKIAKALADRFIALDPDHTADYEKASAAFIFELEKIIKANEEKFKALPADRRNVVVYHHSLVYLFDWLTLKEVATLEPKPGIAPNPSHFASVLGEMKRAKAKVIVQEEFYPKSLSTTLAKLTQGTLVTLHGGTRFSEGETYLNHIQETASALLDALAPATAATGATGATKTP